jgi:UDP-glucose 4-epimerase
VKLLISGASGFIGRRLVEAAIREYGRENVIALSSRTHDLCETIVYDRRDFGVKDADRAGLETVDILIHAGAFTPKSGAEADSVEGSDGNRSFTEKLLAQPFKQLRKIFYLSTLDVYAPAEVITESTPTVPASRYGRSKLDCEKMVEAFAAKTGIASQILRIGHVYGPGEEKYAKFLPAVIKNIVAGEPVELWGDGSELRSLIYIEDVVEAVLAAITQEDELGTINIVGGTAVSIRQLLDLVIGISGKEVEIVPRAQAGARRDLLFDNSKCKAHLLPQETDLLAGLRAEYEHVERLG